MNVMRKHTSLTVLAALLFACGPKSKTVVTPILPGEDIGTAEARLQDSLVEVVKPLPRFIPGL